ncbi:GTP-binding protein [Sulfolobus sp. A20]|uniref:NOG1 family protein n=1 Tax=Saccharolobus sp. A20 TaxID=1891280 RepID=UPI0008461557|nr:GTPase [Sulfolobus sp. A20]AOL15843.1 GTP-binding protein [Sulfolobus sp. A20]TRM85319.1 GTP-binding protein [Sulfolobus sp. F3]
MLNPFDKVKVPAKADDTIRIMLHRLPKINGNTPKDREIRRLMEYYQRIEKYYDFVLSFPKIDELHPFYVESINILIDINKLKVDLYITKKTSLVSMRILKKYMEEIRRSDSRESNKLMREAFGRVSSLLRKYRKYIDEIIDVTVQLKKMKAIDPTLPTIIVSGPPNVGKSTLVSRLSTAKPEVANYPFTTKEIHVGHIIINDNYVQVIDTPGILDRPNEKRNKIEAKAINALKNLDGIIVYMFDPSISSILTVDEQIHLFEEILTFKKVVIPVINKIDDKDINNYDSIVKELSRRSMKWYEISAESGLGLEELKKDLLNRLNISR